MSILCAGNCHVYRVGSLRCTCGIAANGYPPTVGTTMYGLPTSYNPFAPHAPAPPAPDLPLAVLQAARDAGATHLSADGLTAFTVRYGKVLQAEWKGASYGSWLDVGEEMPTEAVKL